MMQLTWTRRITPGIRRWEYGGCWCSGKDDYAVDADEASDAANQWGSCARVMRLFTKGDAGGKKDVGVQVITVVCMYAKSPEGPGSSL